MKIFNKSLTFSLPVIALLASPGTAISVGGVALAATLTGCASPAQRADGRQDARIENRADDRYERRRGD